MDLKVKDLIITGKTSPYKKKPPTVQCIRVPSPGKVILPCRFNKIPSTYRTVDFGEPHIELRPEQRMVMAEIEAEMVRQQGQGVVCKTVFCDVHTGFGKSAIGSIIAARQKGPILIICDTDAVRKGWIGTWKEFFHRDITVAQGSILGDHDVVIMSMQLAKIHKYGPEQYRSYKTVICDEADTLCTQEGADIILNLRPELLIGLTATTRKANGLDKVLDIFWGERKHWIVRKKEFGEELFMDIFLVHTRFQIDSIHNRLGLDWGEMLKNAYSIHERNILIRNLCIMHQNRKILIFTKSVKHLEILVQMLRDVGEDVAFYYKNMGSKSSPMTYFDAHILIVTLGKGGRGYDDKQVSMDFDGHRFDMLIFCQTMNDTEQALGRSRSMECSAYILVDNNDTMKNHSDKIKDVNLKRGAKVRDIYM